MPDAAGGGHPPAEDAEKTKAIRSYLTSTITPALLKALIELEKEESVARAHTAKRHTDRSGTLHTHTHLWHCNKCTDV
jgi:hypothetical protein